MDYSKYPCCGVYAVALAAGQPINKTFKDFAFVLGKQKNWKGRTKTIERDIMLSLYHVEKEPIPTAGKTLIDLKGQEHALVQISGHVVTIKGDIVYDQIFKDGISIHDYHRANAKVKSAYKITLPK